MVSLKWYSGKPNNENRCFQAVNQNTEPKIFRKLLINQSSKKVIRLMKSFSFRLTEKENY